jgi:hypothetical protein
VGMKLERGSWITLSARRSGPWGNRNNIVLAGGSSMRGAWKVQVVDFCFKVGEGD